MTTTVVASFPYTSFDTSVGLVFRFASTHANAHKFTTAIDIPPHKFLATDAIFRSLVRELQHNNSERNINKKYLVGKSYHSLP